MPPIIPPPAPPSNPQTATGSTWIKTGGATSGTVSAVDYAYYIQTAEFDYARKPYNVDTWQGTANIDLTQASAVQPIYGTRLHVNARFKSSCKKIKQLPGGGPYTQQQKFEIYSIATDQNGTSYGTIPDPASGIVFGPRGKVFTSQPWIWQVPWDAARDVEYDIVTVGTSNGFSFSGHGPMQWNPGDDLGEYYSYYMPTAGYPLWGMQGQGRTQPYTAADTYSMWGGAYNLSSEIGYASSSLGIQRMQQFIEDNVNIGLKGGAWNSWQQRYVIPLPIVSDGYNYPQEGDRVVVDPYYSTSRHDYS